MRGAPGPPTFARDAEKHESAGNARAPETERTAPSMRGEIRDFDAADRLGLSLVIHPLTTLWHSALLSEARPAGSDNYLAMRHA